jgi:hypothetical protein
VERYRVRPRRFVLKTATRRAAPPAVPAAAIGAGLAVRVTLVPWRQLQPAVGAQGGTCLVAPASSLTLHGCFHFPFVSFFPQFRLQNDPKLSH